MGYLRVNESLITSFSKAVISLWFRIPTDTMTTVKAISDTPPEGSQSDHMTTNCYFPPLYKIIPLMTFGSLELDSLNNQCSPSFIGVNCSPGFRDAVLAVNLQTPIAMTGGDPDWLPEANRPGCFLMSGRADTGALPDAQDCTIAPDVWNHGLISFDLSGSCSAIYTASPPFSLSSSVSFTWALNDASKVNGSIQPSGGGRWSDNGISNPKLIVAQGLIDYTNITDDNASYSGMTINQLGNPIGMPSTAGFVSNIYKIEMAHIKFFKNVDLDASIESNRRAFITADRRPEQDDTIAESLLGKQPEVWFRTQQDWITGRNRGTAGNFARTATINPFTPDP